MRPDVIGRRYRASVVLGEERNARLVDLLGGARSRGNDAHPLLFAFPLGVLFQQAAAEGTLGAAPERLVHAEQTSRFHGLVPVGSTVDAFAEISQVGQYGLHGACIITSHVEYEGRRVFDASSVLLMVGENASAPIAIEPPERFARNEVCSSSIRRITVREVREYADVSGDVNPIHVSEEMARLAGFPTLVVHGMLTFAFAASIAVDALAGGDASALRRVRTRFSQVLHPEEEVTFAFSRSEKKGVYGVGAVAGRKRLFRNGAVELAA